MNEVEKAVTGERRRSLLFYLAIVTAVACGAFASIWQALTVASDIDLQKRASIFVQESNALLSGIEEAETGQRGYLITEDASYLQPYHVGVKRANQAMNALTSLMKRPEQIVALEAIRADAVRKFDELALTIRLEQEGHRDEALHIVKSNVGRDYMDRLRQNIGAVIAACEAKRAAVLSDETWRVQTTGCAFVGLLIAVAAMLAFAASLQKKAFAGVMLGSERMTRAASCDPLTGLPNRRELDRRLAELATRRHDGAPVTALFVDLDGFKGVNDTLGHATGDALLCDVSRILKGAARADDIVARVGGDEFVVVAAGLSDKAAVEALCQRFVAATRQLPASYGKIGLSIGIATQVLNGVNSRLDLVIRKADEAMYQAKRSGGGYRFSDTADEDAIAA